MTIITRSEAIKLADPKTLVAIVSRLFVVTADPQARKDRYEAGHWRTPTRGTVAA